MREIRPSGSEGGAAETNRPSLPLSPANTPPANQGHPRAAGQPIHRVKAVRGPITPGVDAEGLAARRVIGAGGDPAQRIDQLDASSCGIVRSFCC